MIALKLELDQTSYIFQINIRFNNFYSNNRSFPLLHRTEKDIKILTLLLKFRIGTWRF